MANFAMSSSGRCEPIMGDDTGGGNNTSPTAPGIGIVPESPREGGNDMMCRVESPSVDVDGDSVTYTVEWARDETAFEGEHTQELDGDTIYGASLLEGSTWTCTVTPNDGLTDGPSSTAMVKVGSGFQGWGSQIVNLSEADYVLTGETDGGECAGGSIAPGGDIDGDGLNDLIINDYWWDHPDHGADAGKTYIVLGKDLGANRNISLANAAWAFEGQQGMLEDDPDCEDVGEFGERCGGDWSGHSVGGGMDGDGDGLEDLLICAYRSDEGGTNRGHAGFFSAANLGEYGLRSVGDADITFYGELIEDSLGHSVNWAGDVDGDGMADVIVGSHTQPAAAPSAGRAYLILSDRLGEPGTINGADADYIWNGENQGDQSGKLNAPAGDIDGDGLADFMTSALRNQQNGIGPALDDERRGSGKMYLIRGGDLAGLPRGTVLNLGDAAISWMGEEGGDALGYGLNHVGDFDGDGLADVCAGSFGHSAYGDASGKSYVITATDMETDGNRSLSEASYGFRGEAELDWSGFSAAPAEDVDQDGLSDLLVGAMGHSEEGLEVAGRAYLILAGNTGPGTHNLSDADHIFQGERAWDGAGYKVYGPGDLNGDGMVDLVVTAWQGDAPDGAPGKAYILLNPS